MATPSLSEIPSLAELRREIGGISQKMLTTSLRGLERDGFITRTIYPTIPPKVEYRLTELGRELAVPVHRGQEVTGFALNSPCDAK